MNTDELSLQERYGPEGICFGCGPKNAKGLRIRSFKSEDNEDEYVLKFRPQDHHQAFPGVINGGIIGALFDCHMNWAAAVKLYELHPEEDFPSTVTSTFTINLKRPTPAEKDLFVRAWIEEIRDNFVDTKAEMIVDGKITATASGTFVAVHEGHPAFHRWI